MSFGSSNVTFVGNQAKDTGGGVYLSAPGVGPDFTRASFQSNSAQVGGGMFVTGSSTSFNQLSANFDVCIFISNEAKSTGGAIEIASGSAAITDTLFKGNEAEIGGALRLAGATYLEGCIFEENISDVDNGQAIKSIGHELDLSNCNFTNNLYNCTKGTFLDES